MIRPHPGAGPLDSRFRGNDDRRRRGNDDRRRRGNDDRRKRGNDGLALLIGVDVGLSDTHASEGGQPQGLSLRVDMKVLCAC